MFELSALSQLPGLTQLDLSTNLTALGGDSGRALQHLISMQQLRELVLRSCLLFGSAEAAAAVGQLTQLTSIDLSDNPVELDVISALGGCTNLVSDSSKLTCNVTLT
jgi:hypothetical protein